MLALEVRILLHMSMICCSSSTSSVWRGSRALSVILQHIKHTKHAVAVKLERFRCKDAICGAHTSAPPHRLACTSCSPDTRKSVRPAWRQCFPEHSQGSLPETGCCGTWSGWRNRHAPFPASLSPAPSSGPLQTLCSGSGEVVYRRWGSGNVL